ncbi:hypothetical protein Hanom_Chr09g00773271 [Helianthus anomalus]
MMMMLTMIEVSPTSAAKKVVSEPLWEIDKDRSILYDSGHIRMKKENRGYYDSGHTRMKKKNRGYEDGQESNPDRTTPQSRDFTEWKQEILMKLEIEIELLE